MKKIAEFVEGTMKGRHESQGTDPEGSSRWSETPEKTPHDALITAQRLVAEQRRAVEALLAEACVLEERLRSEAKAAQAAQEYTAAKAKVEAVTIQQRQAEALARGGSERHMALAAELRKAQALVVARRPDADAARAQVAALEQQLRDARQLAEQTLSVLERHEANVKEHAAKLAAAEHEEDDSAARIAGLQAARAAAETEAAAAEKRAEALRKELPGAVQPFSGTNDVRALAARIAEQVSILRPAPQLTG